MYTYYFNENLSKEEIVKLLEDANIKYSFPTSNYHIVNTKISLYTNVNEELYVTIRGKN